MTARIYSSIPQGFDAPRDLIERAARVTVEAEGLEEAEISITCLPDPPIRSLNRRWLGHDWVPDVLAFALHAPGASPIGDVYIGIEQAARQAEEHGVPFREELARLAIHGTLHVLGHDHPDDPGARERSRLYRAQETLLQRVLGGHEDSDDSGPGSTDREGSPP